MRAVAAATDRRPGSSSQKTQFHPTTPTASHTDLCHGPGKNPLIFSPTIWQIGGRRLSYNFHWGKKHNPLHNVPSHSLFCSPCHINDNVSMVREQLALPQCKPLLALGLILYFWNLWKKNHIFQAMQLKKSEISVGTTLLTASHFLRVCPKWCILAHNACLFQITRLNLSYRWLYERAKAEFLALSGVWFWFGSVRQFESTERAIYFPKPTWLSAFSC